MISFPLNTLRPQTSTKRQSLDRAPLETLKSPDRKEEPKIILYFAGAKKALPLNLTNWDACAEICGDDTDSWPGHRIELYPTRTQMGGKMVDCIRIRRPGSAEIPKPIPSTPTPLSDQ